MQHDVIRTFGIDYIFFDLLFLVFIHIFLIRQKKWIPLIAFWLGGLVIMIVDWGFWLQVFHIRELGFPESFLPALPQFWRTFIFMFWFSFTYGLMFCWMFIMFERKKAGIWWTLAVWGGWILVGVLSQNIAIWDDVFTTTRHMGGALYFQAGIVAAGYILLFILRYNWKTILYLFMVGFLCHFMMESSLWISGIRPGSISIMLINSLLESNMGVPLLFILYDKAIKRQ